MRTKRVGLVLVALLALPLFAVAAEYRSAEQASISAGERIAGDMYIAGGNVSSSGSITGDLIAVGGNVLVNGTVTQDLAVGGGSVTVLAAVGDDLRVGGGNVTIGGKVTNDLVAGGGQTQVSGPGVGGDILWGGGTLRLEAPVAGDVTVAGGDVYINAPIGGNVSFNGEKLTLGPAAVVNGNLSYASPNEVVLEQGAVVRGATEYTPREPREVSKGALAGIFSALLLGKFLMTLAGALVLGLFFRRYSEELVASVVARPLPELGRGFAALVLVPVASIVLMVTVVGLPLGILGIVGYIALLIASCIFTAVVLGSLVYGWSTRRGEYPVTWLTILIGAIVYTIVGIIPFVGDLALFVLMLMTLGAITRIKWDAVKTWR